MKNLFLIFISFFISHTTLANEINILLIKGKAEFIREDKVNPLNKETRLRNGDIIKTYKKSFVRISQSKSIITIAPHSYYETSISKEKSSDKYFHATVGTLLYGHLHASFKKDAEVKRVIKTKTSAFGIRGTKILLHVTRDRSEYLERYRGEVHPIPSLNELKKLIDEKSTFSQICCIEGLIQVQTKSGLNRELKEGQVLNYVADGKKAKFKNYTKEILLKSTKAFGLGF